MLYIEPVKLIGEGKYNLNDIKEIKVTDSYMKLDKDFRGCQNEEEINHCTTKQYLDSLLKDCGCLTFSISTHRNVNIISIAEIFTYFYIINYRSPCVLQSN